ncbi:LLM class flavin-dependent oxidoreductase [Achromobacter xylosoxidans]
MLEQARQAERLGYDTFWVAEHHFHEYGAVPNPVVFSWRRCRSRRAGCAWARRSPS